MTVWVSRSITAMEVYHGFLRKPFTPVHAFMYERDPTFVRDVTDENDKKVFVFDYEGDEEILAKRNKLRDDIKAHAYVKWRNFSCEYGGKDEDGKLYTSQLQVRLQRPAAKAVPQRRTHANPAVSRVWRFAVLRRRSRPWCWRTCGRPFASSSRSETATSRHSRERQASTHSQLLGRCTLPLFAGMRLASDCIGSWQVCGDFELHLCWTEGHAAAATQATGRGLDGSSFAVGGGWGAGHRKDVSAVCLLPLLPQAQPRRRDSAPHCVCEPSLNRHCGDVAAAWAHAPEHVRLQLGP